MPALAHSLATLPFRRVRLRGVLPLPHTPRAPHHSAMQAALLGSSSCLGGSRLAVPARAASRAGALETRESFGSLFLWGRPGLAN